MTVGTWLRIWGRRAAMAGIVGLIAIVTLDRLFPPPLHRLAEVSPVVVDRHGAFVHGFTTESGHWRFPADLEAIDPDFVKRLIAVEDKRFFAHPGFDPLAVARAAATNLRRGQIVSGASTLSMQTARLLEPRPRTIPAKIIETFRAVQIEFRLSKSEILEAYLTLAPYGGNIEGVEAASRLWFGKPPRHLTLAEQALLIALPQSPEVRRPDRRADRARMARADILARLAALSPTEISPVMLREAVAADLPTRRTPLPAEAWHFAHERAMAAEDKTLPVQTSLDLRLQAILDQTLCDEGPGRDRPAIMAAGMIVDTATREILALAGSTGRDRPGGWIDMSRAVRSPGSALKPFVYALAFEDGSLGPDTVIEDMPRAFGGYSPENFDHGFRGEVRIRDALQHSLNIPAVAALERVGPDRFRAQIEQTGLSLVTRPGPDDQSGLALALGGAGITMRDLAALYAALADGGRVRPLRAVPARAQADGVQLFSPRIARAVAEILRAGPSLTGRLPAALGKDVPAIAFKTGTSYGYRDAWAAGFDDRYTAVIWVGRADGAPVPRQTGRKVAAPILLSLFDRLGEGRSAPARLAAPANPPVSAPKRPAPVPRPRIIFPGDGVEVFLSAKDRPVRVAARGGSGGLRWYVDGAPLGDTLWRPSRPGFYRLEVVDRAGRSAAATVRVLSAP